MSPAHVTIPPTRTKGVRVVQVHTRACAVRDLRVGDRVVFANSLREIISVRTAYSGHLRLRLRGLSIDSVPEDDYTFTGKTPLLRVIPAIFHSEDDGRVYEFAVEVPDVL